MEIPLTSGVFIFQENNSPYHWWFMILQGRSPGCSQCIEKLRYRPQCSRRSCVELSSLRRNPKARRFTQDTGLVTNQTLPSAMRQQMQSGTQQTSIATNQLVIIHHLTGSRIYSSHLFQLLALYPWLSQDCRGLELTLLAMKLLRGQRIRDLNLYKHWNHVEFCWPVTPILVDEPSSSCL